MLTISLICALAAGYESKSVASPIDDITLGQAASYSLLAGSALTKGDVSSISGDQSSIAGIFPSTIAPDEATSFVTTGAADFENGTTGAGSAQTDLGSAISQIASLVPTEVSALFSDQTLTPGVYAAPAASALAITVGLVLDAGGDPNARFIFRTDAALNIDASITISLTGGAQERNVFWLVGSALTIGAGADVPGNFLVVSAATFGATAVIRGSLLCQGAVTIGANSSINYDHLTTATPTPTPSPTDTSTGGNLSISAPSSISFGNVGSPSLISLTIGTVTVTDLRGVSGGGTWVATAVSSELAPVSGAAISASVVGYAAGTIATTGTLAAVANDQMNLAGDVPVVTASAINGSNSASWTPTITVNVPAGMAVGIYSGTITQSVA
jgi:hypothetical protein